MLKVLFVVPYAPTRIRTRPYHLIRALRAAGCAVTVATVYESVDEQAMFERGAVAEPLTAQHKVVNLLRALPTELPLQAAICFQPVLADRLLDLALHHDVVHVEHLRGAHYALRLAGRVPLVWDSVDCIAHLFSQTLSKSAGMRSKLMALIDLRRTRRFEGELVARLPLTTVTSDVDREQLLMQSGGVGEVAVVPNGVDTDYFRPNATVMRQRNNLVFSGKLSYHANVAMCQRLVSKILPLIHQTHPDVTLTLVGKDPPRSVRQLASDCVEVTGTVPDIRPFLQRARVAVVPQVYGAGIQNKVLEAMACGTPVVTAPAAIAATIATPNRHCLVANDNETFAAYVTQLIDNDPTWDSISNAALALVHRNYSWHAAAKAFIALYRSQLYDSLPINHESSQPAAR